MPKRPLDDLLRKSVVVRANGLAYRGILVEVTPGEVLLRRETGYVSIAMDHIVSIDDPSQRWQKNPMRFVDPSFYGEGSSPWEEKKQL